MIVIRLKHCASTAILSTVKYAEHDEACAIEPILEHVGSVENLQHQLPILTSPCERPAEPRKSGQELRLVSDLARNNRCKMGMQLMNKISKALKVTERVS